MTNSSKKLPFFFVGKSITDLRKERFKQEKHPILSSQLGKEETLNIWYTREHIVKLLEEIDHASGDGIRLHFGAYEAGHEFEGQLCLVMNVTKTLTKENFSERKDIILEDQPDFIERSKTDRNLEFSQSSKVKRDFNFGSPCPPRCK